MLPCGHVVQCTTGDVPRVPLPNPQLIKEGSPLRVGDTGISKYYAFLTRNFFVVSRAGYAIFEARTPYFVMKSDLD